jgi:hypothetical protein
MNKYLKIVLAILIPSFIFIYFFIPNEIKLSEAVWISQPNVAVSRSLISIENWSQWVPSNKINNNIIELEKGQLSIQQSLLSSVNTNYTSEKLSIPVTFFTTAKGKDTSIVEYEAFIDNRHVSPIVRISNYWWSLKVKSQMGKVLEAAGKFYGNTEHLYGFPIVHDRVKDSVLISTNTTFTDTPSIQAQYDMIHLLETYVQQNNGLIKGDPMVNITKIGEGTIFTQVALPLAKSIPTTTQFQIKKMVLGNILNVNVTGDAHKVFNAFRKTENYIHDRAIISPAIPFIVYNTNRLTEKDASKWKSTIYYPIY